MRHLVRGDGGVAAAEHLGVLVRARQHERLAVRDHAGVLHRAEVERRRNGDGIELRVGIRRSEVVLEDREEGRRRLAGRGELGAAPARREVAQRRARGSRAPARHPVERPHRERDEVARERLRHGEDVPAPAGGGLERGRALLRHVARHEVRHGRVDRHPPRRLPLRLVEARERPARRGGLELGEHVPVSALALAEEAARGEGLQGTAVRDDGDRLAGREGRAVRLEAHELLAPRDDPRGDAPRALHDLRALDIQPHGVQPQHARLAGEAQVDADLAREARRLRIHREPQLVIERRRGVAEAEGRRIALRRVRESGTRQEERDDERSEPAGGKESSHGARG